MSDQYQPFSITSKHDASYIVEASEKWVQVISGAQAITAQLNNVISDRLMSMYGNENKALNKLLSSMTKPTASGASSNSTSQSGNLNELTNKLSTAQKEWDNAISEVQTTAQQQTSQMSAQGNDASQATISAGLMAQLLQNVTGLIQSAL